MVRKRAKRSADPRLDTARAFDVDAVAKWEVPTGPPLRYADGLGQTSIVAGEADPNVTPPHHDRVLFSTPTSVLSAVGIWLDCDADCTLIAWARGDGAFAPAWIPIRRIASPAATRVEEVVYPGARDCYVQIVSGPDADNPATLHLASA